MATINPSTKREREGAQRMVGMLNGAHAVLSQLFDAGKLPRDMTTARALDDLRQATTDLTRALKAMEGS